MANEVYANMMEVSCKAAAGKAICAFPDVCMTPPQTPATPPGVPIPYPNTGMASDCSDGSSTVKISGQEVMLKNKSYFKRSSGDEAGCAPMKGVVTHTNMGKVYFNAWSMDVKVEGENVVRNLDLTTHNHGSIPGNSLTWPYLDNMTPAQQKVCAAEKKAVDDACPKCDTNDHAKDDCPTVYANASKNKGYRNDDCVKAKRCMLVPYGRSKNQKGGCCPGQTAHHLIPKHHFPKSVSKGYSGDDAPCVCAEGHSWHRNCEAPFNNAEKTHPDLHDIQDAAERESIDIVEQNIAAGNDVGGRTPEYAMDYDDARQTAVDTHKDVFKDCKPPCSEACLKAQIDAYHQQSSVGVKDDTLLRTKRVGASPD
ncbi:MAG: PAAR-like domain-containing protein [Steroidobacteraceae bacterium]